MNAKTKTVNYSDEMTNALVEAYKASPTAETVAAFAEKFGKTAASIRAKLSREGVYQKKEYVTKKGVKPVSKEQHVVAIAALIGKDEEFCGSLEKANKNVLEAIEKALVEKANAFDMGFKAGQES